MLKEGKGKEEIFKATGATVGVNQANFAVESGEIFVIMGLSGSGKSTLLRMLNRLIEPTSGQVLIDNENIVEMNAEQLRELRRKKISMVFQKFALFPHRTVIENVEFGLEIQGISAAERREKAMESLKLVGLESWADSYPNQLSGGMQQRVGLARALANDPEILLMDEAFSALDPLIRKEMQEELVDLQRSMNKTVIFITHDLDEALRIGDRIVLMRHGEIVQIGTPEEILTNPADAYVERFVEDVNLGKVLTAETVMRKAETIVLGKDGIRVAGKKMRDKGIPTLVVVDRKRYFKGMVTADQVKEAFKKEKKVEDILVKDVVKVKKDTPLQTIVSEMGQHADATIPAVVVDDEDRVLGIVGRGAVWAALAGQGGDSE
ncbi:glycine betaine/L-proline ABC transporter ATP-binding protein [Thermoactinomyces intermedius]|uniref:Quaternary amine transport ATP-binding protein n=1 Tax=Thermoactinomyces intermedius TaxID=2024 RepID=A0A8I1DFQ9_THEIN|nr:MULTISPECIES: glycine betaine/L-proline ABC transporter ATP-binding protein [Thermoactinomyces]MBA4547397.1 glycine betaine/L-proline ABC transporter ATP-binding protein [Thermoactinomyces intermedius]MBA4835923.1 glycine betaine/L-proline ABC transporter ATP-binding protein [Thermoactinomyces intermedius]MBH8596399.1 glycine betaine/L-proline ABC transporter ATP-binding protein [Thermoactinomyces intermedius]MBH8602558.1 glycine betaine/L-proline ABC transporter ATP-binding protein [Thermoa